MWEHLIQTVIDWGLATFLTSLVTACGVGGFIWKQVTRNKRQDALLLSIARCQLMRDCQYYLQQGCISVNDFAFLQQQFDAYALNGGNGVVKELFEHVKELQIREDCEQKWNY